LTKKPFYNKIDFRLQIATIVLPINGEFN